MIKIKATNYYSDCNQREFTKSFADLKEFEDWIFNQMSVEYRGNMNFPTKKPSGYIGRFSITYTRGWVYFIHQIESEKGILYSDGKYTNKQEHISNTIADFNKQCIARSEGATFNFVD